MAGDLKDRVVIVTGAGRGLGRSHALLLASKGARVVVNDLADGGVGPAHDVVEEIRAAGGIAVADGHSVASWDSAAAIIGTAIDSFGALDGLVCNAGFLRDRMLTNMSEQEWDDIIKVHQYGSFYTLRHAAEHWRGQHKSGSPVNGAVVMTTAISGMHSNVGQINYGAAKAAIALMAVSAARELGRYCVRVNAISPVARTRLTEGAPIPANPDYDMLDPAHASAIVGWLMSADCTATAQVYGLFGRSVVRYKGWTPDEHAQSESDWTVEALAEAMRGWTENYTPGEVPGLPFPV